MTKMMNTEDLIQANTAAIANMQSVANTALATAESLAALNLGTAREALSDGIKNAKAVMSGMLAKLDLVTREEFDVQADVLARTREKLKDLEARVAALEQKAGGQ